MDLVTWENGLRKSFEDRGDISNHVLALFPSIVWSSPAN